MKMFKDEVASFQDRLRRRAKEKRDAAIAEYEAEEKVENQFLRIKVSKNLLLVILMFSTKSRNLFLKVELFQEKRIAAAPGGLDPIEVYDSLPEEMKTAFDSQNVEQLQQVAINMDKEVGFLSFIYLFQLLLTTHTHSSKE